MKHKISYRMLSTIGGILVTLVMLLSMLSVVSVIENRDYQKERLAVMERFLRYQTEAEVTINESICLLRGYIAYLDVVPFTSEKESEQFIESLLSNTATLIRNIGIIKDTTVLWNYPKEGNEKTIGVDLATVEAQREAVLNVKNDLKPRFLGPVELYQGGTGFIVRLPITRDGAYWGQVSIVLDSDRYFQRLSEIARKDNLNIAVFQESSFPSEAMYGDKTIVERDGLVLHMDILNSRWVVAGEPTEGWSDTGRDSMLLRVFAVILSAISGVLVYSTLSSKGQLRRQAYHDSLTGLLNRHALNDYYHNVSGSDNASIEVVMLDIDHFKDVNDIYGHNAGDLVLIEFSKKLKALGLSPKKVFRIGGDEFLLILSQPKGEEGARLDPEQIRQGIAFAFQIGKDSIQVSPSIGIANCPRDAQSLYEAVIIADKNMYSDKAKRRAAEKDSGRSASEEGKS